MNKTLEDNHVQNKRLFTQWGAIPQQHHSPASQATEHFDDLLYHQVSVALQALLNMAEARRTSVLGNDKMIMASQCVTKHTVVGLEGGEFLLHPEANAIMEWFKDNHPNYTLLSNCLAPQR